MPNIIVAEAELADLNAGAAEGAELHAAQLTEGGAPGNRRARRNSSRLAAGYSLIVRRGRAIASVFVLVVALGIAPAARAADPGRWILTGASSVPVTYWQGLTSNPAESNFFFVGIFRGLWKTTPKLGQTAGVNDAIPPSVAQTEGYNHIGDPTWNPGDGGRVILPMECYDPGAGQNTCSKGAFGVANPATLAFRYYVNLDPAEIPKAMWAETSPNGKLIWTSSGNDLLAYRSSDVTQANSGPSGPVIHAVRRLPGAVPPTGVTGAVFREGKLLLAGESNGVYQVWSVNTTDRRAHARDREADLRRVRGPRRDPDARRQASLADRAIRPGMRADLRPDQRPAPLPPRRPPTTSSTWGHEYPGRDAARARCSATVHATFNGAPLRDVRGEVRRRGGAHQ